MQTYAVHVQHSMCHLKRYFELSVQHCLCVNTESWKCMQYNHSLSGWSMLAEPIWRQVLSAGLVCWASWRSCGGGSAWRMRSWPSRCPSEATSPPCCNSRTTARCVLSPQAMFRPHFTWFIIPCLSLFSSNFQKVELFNLLQRSTCFFWFF